ncbi:hypothetical protein HNQ88_002619 [Aureibacter tunicatorum]|uniref:Uncharacterized protein n=1 Tax=Aureibacter tunicatorum TaxID=866807 RepID=A0AAE3XKM6_9BACT|nr:hypothetical protein [Aureibacter tunicatorum]BDD04048.1 hypothetical protein AUTU_15310 [Aureibacter tunicatorum]
MVIICIKINKVDFYALKFYRVRAMLVFNVYTKFLDSNSVLF